MLLFAIFNIIFILLKYQIYIHILFYNIFCICGLIIQLKKLYSIEYYFDKNEPLAL